MKKIIIFVDWFLPGYKAGGQIQSCANLAFALKDVMQVYMVTSDRDLGDTGPYANTELNIWIQKEGNIQVMYLTPDKTNIANFKRIMQEVQPHCIYVNSMFSVPFTLLPLLAARQYKCKKVLAPRGMLHKGALLFSPLKKKLFLAFVKLFAILKDVVFQATDAKEVTDIKRKFVNNNVIFINDFPNTRQLLLKLIPKQAGYLRCIFVSRLQKKKNLDYLLTVLTQCRGNIELTIIGPKEDESYWQECEQIISKLPPNIRTDYLGSIPNSQLDEYYRQSHLFILPTLGENFGHVIFESLVNGRPVLISDQTAWQDLAEHKAGWIFPLAQSRSFAQAINQVVDWQQDEFDDACRHAWEYAHDYLKQSNLTAQYLALFAS